MEFSNFSQGAISGSSTENRPFAQKQSNPFQVDGQKCPRCEKHVYTAEGQSVSYGVYQSKLFHKKCVKCDWIDQVAEDHVAFRPPACEASFNKQQVVSFKWSFTHTETGEEETRHSLLCPKHGDLYNQSREQTVENLIKAMMTAQDIVHGRTPQEQQRMTKDVAQKICNIGIREPSKAPLEQAEQMYLPTVEQHDTPHGQCTFEPSQASDGMIPEQLQVSNDAADTPSGNSGPSAPPAPASQAAETQVAETQVLDSLRNPPPFAPWPPGTSSAAPTGTGGTDRLDFMLRFQRGTDPPIEVPFGQEAPRFPPEPGQDTVVKLWICARIPCQMPIAGGTGTRIESQTLPLHQDPFLLRMSSFAGTPAAATVTGNSGEAPTQNHFHIGQIGDNTTVYITPPSDETQLARTSQFFNVWLSQQEEWRKLFLARLDDLQRQLARLERYRDSDPQLRLFYPRWFYQVVPRIQHRVRFVAGEVRVISIRQSRLFKFKFRPPASLPSRRCRNNKTSAHVVAFSSHGYDAKMSTDIWFMLTRIHMIVDDSSLKQPFVLDH